MPHYILDASAVLALLHQEPEGDSLALHTLWTILPGSP